MNDTENPERIEEEVIDNTAAASGPREPGEGDLPENTDPSPDPESSETAEAVEGWIDPEKEENGDDPVEAALENELEKWKDIAARSQADLENYRKRMAREKSEAIQYANASLLRSLLPVLDNFEMGLDAARAEGEGSVIYQGMVMVQKQLQDFLSENRVEVIEAAEGGEFDPNLHEAIQQLESTGIAEGKVISTMRKGYRLKDRLLRPANVIVAVPPARGDDELDQDLVAGQVAQETAPSPGEAEQTNREDQSGRTDG